MSVTFDNRFLILDNPLPAVTQEALHKRAGISMRRRNQADREVFVLDLNWGGGQDHKTHSLLPGKSVRMPEMDGREIAADFLPVGDLCARAPGLAVFSDDRERKSARIEALLIAEQHYHTVGSQQIDEVRNMRGHSVEESEGRYRGSIYKSYFLAMAKEELIREHREKLEAAA